MDEAPQKPRGPQWNRTVEREDRSVLHDAIVAFAFVVLCFVPAAIWPDRGFPGPGGDGWAAWPPLLLGIVLTLCLIDDHFERSPRDRVLVVLSWFVFYIASIAVLATVMHWNQDPVPARAWYRAACAVAPLVYGLNSSRTMVRWARHSQGIRHDASGSPYLQ